MKKLFKNVNVAGLVVVLIAAGVMTTQSAFKKADSLFYPKQGSSYLSTPLNPAEENAPNGWRCDGLSGICSAQFSTPPSPTNQTPTGTIRSGVYVNY